MAVQELANNTMGNQSQAQVGWERCRKGMLGQLPVTALYGQQAESCWINAGSEPRGCLGHWTKA